MRPMKEDEMEQSRDLQWKLSAEGTFDEIRRFVGALGPATFASARPVAAGTSGQPSPLASGAQMLAGGKLLRSKDSLTETHVLQATTSVQDLLALVREYWTLLRDRSLADANPVKIFASNDDSSIVVFVFR